MLEVCQISELLILCSINIELFFSDSLLDLLDTIGPLAKHTLFILHHNWPSFDHTHGCLANCELLHFLCAGPCRYADDSDARG